MHAHAHAGLFGRRSRQPRRRRHRGQVRPRLQPARAARRPRRAGALIRRPRPRPRRPRHCRGRGRVGGRRDGACRRRGLLPPQAPRCCCGRCRRRCRRWRWCHRRRRALRCGRRRAAAGRWAGPRRRGGRGASCAPVAAAQPCVGRRPRQRVLAELKIPSFRKKNESFPSFSIHLHICVHCPLFFASCQPFQRPTCSLNNHSSQPLALSTQSSFLLALSPLASLCHHRVTSPTLSRPTSLTHPSPLTPSTFQRT